MKSRICTILCLLTLFGFVAVFVQGQWRPFSLKPLHGYTSVTEKPELTFCGFAQGDYQSCCEQYISENFGFREWFIRIYNQAAYDCFGIITNDNIAKGEHQELYLTM